MGREKKKGTGKIRKCAVRCKDVRTAERVRSRCTDGVLKIGYRKQLHSKEFVGVT